MSAAKALLWDPHGQKKIAVFEKKTPITSEIKIIGRYLIRALGVII